MRIDNGPVSTRVRHRDDESDRSPHRVRHRRALELRRTQLGLEVQQRPLNLNEDACSRCLQDHVGSPAIRRWSDRHLQPDVPPAVRLDADPLGDPQLSGVAQPDAIGREEAQREVMSGRRREPMHD